MRAIWPRRLGAIVGAAVIALCCAACSSSTAEAPDTSPVGTTASASVIEPSGSSTVAVSSSLAPPTPSVIDVPTPTPASSSASLDPEAQEMADRAAIEAQWIKFWEIYNEIVRTPVDQRPQALDAVSVEPIRTQILEAASRFDSQGLDYYGAVVQHPYWVTPVNGAAIRCHARLSGSKQLWIALPREWRETIGRCHQQQPPGGIRHWGRMAFGGSRHSTIWRMCHVEGICVSSWLHYCTLAAPAFDLLEGAIIPCSM